MGEQDTEFIKSREQIKKLNVINDVAEIGMPSRFEIFLLKTRQDFTFEILENLES